MKREMEEDGINSADPHLSMSMREYIKSNTKRILVVFFLIYLFRLVEVGSAVYWYRGLRWPNVGYQLFPIPISPSSPEIISLPQLLFADEFLYIVFVGNGMWIIWIALSLIYILLPSMRKVRDTRRYP